MEQFITLQTVEGPFNINVRNIVYYRPYGPGSFVKLRDEIGLTVAENPEMIQALIADTARF